MAHDTLKKAAVVILGGAVLACGTAGDGAGGSLPDFGAVPAFTLLERGGGTVTRDDLVGRVWVADFIFTRCAGVCIRMTSRMAGLQETLGGTEGLVLVSITVDPEYDRPDVLARYAAEHGASEERWLFLTGDLEAIRSLAEEGFHLSAGGGPVESSGAGSSTGVLEISHSQRFALVDARGRIRGYYDGTDEDAVRRLARDARALAGRGA
jgi:protein SCO1/2